jgi:hypothetical protein
MRQLQLLSLTGASIFMSHEGLPDESSLLWTRLGATKLREASVEKVI